MKRQAGDHGLDRCCTVRLVFSVLSLLVRCVRSGLHLCLEYSPLCLDFWRFLIAAYSYLFSSSGASSFSF